MTPTFYFLNSKRAQRAAADVIREAYSGGAFVLDPDETAGKILDAVRSAIADGTRFRARMKDGRPVEVVHIDRGDVVPGYDKDGNRFEAFTSYIRLTIRPRVSLEDLGEMLENYIQCDRSQAEMTGDVEAFRSAADRTAFESMGIDMASLEEALAA